MTDETLTGHIESITFHSEETGFSVLKIKTKTHPHPLDVTGQCLKPVPGEHIECTGQWSHHSKYGRQFQCSHIRMIPPSTAEGMEKYLASGLVKGIGAHFAKRLVKAFGDEVFNVIENTPERLKELEGIGPKRQKELVDAWSDQKVIRDIIVFLHSHGLGSARAMRIYKTYGEQAVQHIQQNPYRLALDIPGIGFKTADQLAHQLGIAPDALIRAYAGLYHTLQMASNSGHCALPTETLLIQTETLLSIPYERTEIALKHLLSEGQLIEDQGHCFLREIHELEGELADQLARIQIGTPPWADQINLNALPINSTTLQLSPSQQNALITALTHKVTIITGGPGVGKTTLVQTILNVIRSTGASLVLCAPTGRAAKRLNTATEHVAKTIHRLLEFDPVTYGFSRHQHHPLEGDVLIIDEASMIDLKLMTQLMRAVHDQMAVIIVGDADQLPSVGPGAVLTDLIQSHCLPTVCLTEIFRQAQHSQIILNAHKINQGYMPHSGDPDQLSDFYLISADTLETQQRIILSLIQSRIPKRFNFDPIEDIQVLTPMQKGPLGARALNTLLQAALNPNTDQGIDRYGQHFAVGDKVLQTLNNYDKQVFNGDLGLIQHIDTTQQVIQVLFDQRSIEYQFNELDELTLAYATTIHKAQGSEFPAVIIPIAMSHFMLLERHLLYTGVTRGRQLVVLVGERRAVKMATQTNQAGARHTQLTSRIQACLSRID
ncbi:MAG: ATP-dependent RecD-like DNA helicase [Legionellales bacterium]|nr:ATP-dependent RecD-like DNA helicase [Legionellales bacterium]